MTAKDAHAYRASEEFAAAIRERNKESMRFGREVIKPWDDAHPDTPALWAQGGFSLDRKCVGFADPGGPVPEGLSRNKQRQELIPKWGRNGDPWRDAMERLNQKPKIGPVFQRFGLDPLVWSTTGNWIYRPGIADTPDGMFFRWPESHPEPGEHLTEVALSEYYAAVEKRDREKAVAS